MATPTVSISPSLWPSSGHNMATPPVSKSPPLFEGALQWCGYIIGIIKARIIRLLIGLQLCFVQSFHLILYLLSGGWVKNGRGNDGVSPDREEDNHVSSGNNEGRLDDDSGSSDARLNGSMEEQERRAGETPGPSTVISTTKKKKRRKRRKSTVISHGTESTDGLEGLIQSVIVQWLRQGDAVNLDKRERIFQHFNLETLLRNTPSYSDILNQITNDVRSQLLETNPNLSFDELMVYCTPICWSSRKRVDFFCCVSDRLLLKAKDSNQQDELKELLSKEMESQEPPVFYGEWINKIDLLFRPYRPVRPPYNYISVGGLLRFIRNQWTHRLELSEEFKLKFTGRGGEKRFYDYFDARFPNLLIKTYGAVYRFCREEKFRNEETWFENFCGSENLLVLWK